MIVLLAVLTFRIFPHRTVTVLSDGRAMRVAATFDPLEEGLDAAHVSLSPGDRVLHATGGNYASIAVERAMPVLIEADGRRYEVRTQATTIAGALASAGIALRPGDAVYLDGQLTSPRGPLTGAAYTADASRLGTAVAVAAGSPRRQSVEQVASVEVVRSRPVTVIVDGLEIEVHTATATVGHLLGEMGIRIGEVDLVQPSPSAPVTAGMTVRIAQAKSINIVIDQVHGVLYTRAETVGDVLALFGLAPGPDDVLSHPPETPLVSGMTLVVGVTRTELVEVTKPVPPGIRYESDPSLPPGADRFVQGTPGEELEVWEVTYKNGEEVDRRLVESRGIVKPPVDSVHYVGPQPDKDTLPTLDAPGFSGTYTKKLRVWATWYDARHGGKSPDDPYYGITATGLKLRKGICAVDPDVIPLHTRFYVPGYGECYAGDVGGAIKGNKVDLGFPEGAGPNPWHTGWVDIYILD
ncbi:MAG: hypothetical protein Kow0010_25110 [Dehalococcoidia bacterium]